MTASQRVPNFVNGLIVAIQLAVVCGCIMACKFATGVWWIAVIAAFALAVNSVYFAVHEAEHGVLFSNRLVNQTAGVILSLFMPASYSLIRRVHLAHHIHNRSDEETFDIYFDNEPAWWKKAQFFGILTGGFWLAMVAGNVVLAILPMRWINRSMQIDRPSAALTQYVDHGNTWRIRAESWLVIVFHSAIAWWLGPRAAGYAMMYLVFGTTWSTLQYVHHYGTCRDVLRGAKNLRYGRVLDTLWLHHGWHLTHHLHPTSSWLHLPKLAAEDEQPMESLASAYLKMWHGPKLTHERISNLYEGYVEQA